MKGTVAKNNFGMNNLKTSYILNKVGIPVYNNEGKVNSCWDV